MDKRKLVVATNVLLMVLLICSVGAVTVTYIQREQTIKQKIKEVSTEMSVLNFTLPEAVVGLVSSNLTSNALSISYNRPGLTLEVNQTESQRSTLTTYYSALTLTIRKAGTTTAVLTINLLVDTVKTAVLSDSVGSYNFDYYFEYTPKSTSEELVIKLAVSLKGTE